jgi:hypothetical protein
MTEFTITPDDIGRYVRHRAIGTVGKIVVDRRSGLPYPSFVFHWQPHAKNLEYVTVTIDGSGMGDRGA